MNFAAIVLIVIAAESAGNPHLVGDHGAAHGTSRGIMQIQYDTWVRYTSEPWHRAYDPALNKKVGEIILRDIAKRYGKQVTVGKILYSYNTGKVCKKLHVWTHNKVYRKVAQEEIRAARKHNPDRKKRRPHHAKNVSKYIK